MPRWRRFEKRNAVVIVVEGNEDAVLSGPFPHPASTAVPPGQNFDSPASNAHALEVCVETCPFRKPAAVAGEEHRSARVAVEIEAVTQHLGLEQLVNALLTAT